MENLLPIAIGILFGCGCYLCMRRNIVRVLLGIMLLSQAANLLIFSAAGVSSGQPPVIPADDTVIRGAYADPLPQALVLTAIVIGFAVLAFAIALVLRAYHKTGSDDLDTFRRSDS
ncbi:MAG TPA: Na+/H+ antiporter subunit C [Luteolibacter sp.]|nr:Na+/H+ antiporter subunit C [Luteolibacter sp.]